MPEIVLDTDYMQSKSGPEVILCGPRLNFSPANEEIKAQQIKSLTKATQLEMGAGMGAKSLWLFTYVDPLTNYWEIHV